VSRRNYLIIQTDAQHHAHLGCAGHHLLRTPHIDALAERGTRFDCAYTVSGVCVPSRASFVTGRYPIAHSVTSNDRVLPAGERTFGTIFRDAGYNTGYFGKTHFGAEDVAAHGWMHAFVKRDYQQYLDGHSINATYPERRENIDLAPLRYWSMGTSRIPSEHYFEPVVSDRACAFMRDADAPFVAFVNFVAPHGPFTPPKPYDTMYVPSDVELAPRCDGETEHLPPQPRRWVEQNGKYINDDELRVYLALVYGLIAMVDDCVGKMVAALRDAGRYDETVIIFTSDHGDFASRYGILGKSWLMIDDLMRIPLVVSHPEHRDKPRTTDALAQNIDILPSLMADAGIEQPSLMHGRSILPLLIGDAPPVHDYVFGHNGFAFSEVIQPQSMVRDRRYKYVHLAGDPGLLYDLCDDPHETRNLVADPTHRDTLERLRGVLLDWHVQHTGGLYDHDNANYWEDETLFYDETKFTGERIKPSGKPRAW
jgi:arylsulfatase A-like enzyme